MRAFLRIPLVLVFLLGAVGANATTAGGLKVPTQGSPSQRVLALWTQTKSQVIADANKQYSDTQLVARGAPLLDAWTTLDKSLGSSSAAGDSRAVLKFLGDFYGREQSSPERRLAVRNDTRLSFGPRIDSLEERLKD